MANQLRKNGGSLSSAVATERADIDPVSVSVEQLEHWYGVQTKRGKEEQVATSLTRAGIETFLPRVQNRRKSLVFASAATAEPLFQRYLFVRCDVIATGHLLRYTRGVVRLLGTSDGPSSLDDSIIDAIRQRTGADGCVRLDHEFAVGERVCVTSGPLKDFVGVFQGSTNASCRVRLLILAISGTARAIVDPETVEKLR